ncbi:MAG: single-stranded DNA-binding protein [Steroidobacteraceae bacterium]
MNSFTLTAIGNLSRDPELIVKGERMCARFCLIGHDYAGRDEQGGERELLTSIWFVAFGALGEAIARNAFKGDQLILEAQVRADNWVDRQGERRYDYAHVVQGFRFGAPGRSKREELARGAQASEAPAPCGQAAGREA